MAAHGATTFIVAALALGLGGVQDPVPPAPPQPWQLRPHAPKAWVAFSAELEFFTPGQPPQYGRHVQDEHGCRLRETVEANGDRVVTITNEHTNTTYRFARGAWTAQSMRPGPEPARPPTALRVDGKAPPSRASKPSSCSAPCARRRVIRSAKSSSSRR